MEKQNFIYLILSALKEHYLSSSEITQKLNMDHIDFDKALFYPTLSRLLLQKYLCYNWIPDKRGFPVKYYHITKNGLAYIKQTK
jgi:DNA-binding PadR family transcriptional regulator